MFGNIFFNIFLGISNIYMLYNMYNINYKLNVIDTDITSITNTTRNIHSEMTTINEHMKKLSYNETNVKESLSNIFKFLSFEDRQDDALKLLLKWNKLFPEYTIEE